MINADKVVIGIQSRLRSSRLPAKALLKFGDDSIVGFIIKRALSYNFPVYLLTSKNKPDDIIVNEALKYSPTGIIRGSEEDVLERFVKLQNLTNANILVRVTADNPLTDFRLIPLLLEHMKKNEFNYATVDKRYSLEGTNLELFTSQILKDSFENDKSFVNKDNVTPYMKKSIKDNELKTFIQNKIFQNSSIADYSVTIDTINDYIKVFNLIEDVKNINKSYLETNLLQDCLNLISEENYKFPIGRNHPLN